MIEEHNKNIIVEFSKQAPLIAREKSSGFYTNVDWFCDHLPKLTKEMTILEVAAGTCILAQALAPQVKKVVALDLTIQMLDQGKAQCVEKGIENIEFIVEDASSMSFPDNTFDMVFCRWTFHHLKNIEQVAKEMTRVCKPGGWVVVMDLESPENLTTATELNRIETLRDPSHVWCPTQSEMYRILEQVCGLKIITREQLKEERDLELWFDMALTSEAAKAEIREILKNEILKKETVTGLEPFFNLDTEYYIIDPAVIADSRWRERAVTKNQSKTSRRFFDE